MPGCCHEYIFISQRRETRLAEGEGHVPCFSSTATSAEAFALGADTLAWAGHSCRAVVSVALLL